MTPEARSVYDRQFRWRRRMHKHRKCCPGRFFVVTERDWRRLCARYLWRCHWCGNKPDRLEMDHLWPLCRGGRHSIGNIVPACQECNAGRGTQFPPVSFRLFGPQPDPEF